MHVVVDLGALIGSGRAFWSVACCCCLASCAPATTPTISTPSATVTDSGTASAVDARAARDDRCADLVRSLVDAFQVTNLGISSDVASGVGLLNQWKDDCGKELIEQAQAELHWPPHLEMSLTSEQKTYLARAQFVRRDSEHLRDCALFRKVSTFAPAGTSETERVARLFAHVVRHVDLVAQHPAGLPLSPYDVYLLGQGTARDRTWIFGNILRQLGIDAVVIEAADGSAPPLVGALLDPGVFLFDAEAGLGVPGPQSEGANPTVTIPATWQQAAHDPGVFRKLDEGDIVYPWTADKLKQARVSLITQSAFWAPRMQALQSRLVGDTALVIWESLIDQPDSPGAWSRAQKAGAELWSPDHFSLWPYPDAELLAHARMDDAAYEQYQRLLKPLQVPAKVELNRKRVYEVKSYRSGLLRLRLLELNGQFSQAAVGYTDLRLSCKDIAELPLPEDVIALHRRAEDDAAYWSALCQFEQGETRIASESLERYLKGHPQGVWRRAANYLLALAHASERNWRRAVETLESVPRDGPDAAGWRWLLRHWRAQSPK